MLKNRSILTRFNLLMVFHYFRSLHHFRLINNLKLIYQLKSFYHLKFCYQLNSSYQFNQLINIYPSKKLHQLNLPAPFKIICQLAILISLFTITVNAATAPKLVAEADHTQIYIGEPVILTVYLSYDGKTLDDKEDVNLLAYNDCWAKPVDYDIKKVANNRWQMGHFLIYASQIGRAISPIFSYNIDNQRLETEPISIEVLSLPAAGKPPQFTGVVGNCQLKATLPKRQIKLGETAKVLIEIDTNTDTNAFNAPVIPLIADAEIEGPNSLNINDNSENNKIFALWELKVKPTIAGEFTIPPIVVAYFEPKSKTYKIVETAPLQLLVIGKSEGTNLLPYGLLMIVLIAGAVLIIWLWKRSSKSEPIPEPEPTPIIKSVWEQAQEIIRSADKYFAQGDEKAGAQKMLVLIELIAAERLLIPASELNLDRILMILRLREIDPEQIQEFANFYQQCQFICFAAASTNRSTPSFSPSTITQVTDFLLQL